MKKLMIQFLLMSLLAIFAMSQIQCGSSQANSEEVKDKDNAEQKKEKAEEKELVPVETTDVTRGTITSSLLFSSNLETEKMVDVYSRIQGLISKIHVEEGDYVQKGQVLLELEPETYEMSEAKAKLGFQQQEANYRRLQAMYEKDLISKEEFEQAEYEMEIAKLSWEEAQLNLEYTRVTAPISGVIGVRMCRLGDRIQPNDQLFQISNTDEIIAVVHVPEKEVGNVEKGQSAYLTSDNLMDQHFDAWVKRVSPIIDAQTGTFKVTVGVRNDDGVLKPGMFTNVHIITDQHKDTVLVPKTAIVYENELMNVFVVRDSIAHKVTLNAGFQDHERVEVLSELEENDKIIVVGQSGLKDQTKVKVVSHRNAS